jgi:hypothetical protein
MYFQCRGCIRAINNDRVREIADGRSGFTFEGGIENKVKI